MDASADERLTRGIDLDDRVVVGVGRERELDVAAALDAERPDDGQGRGAEPLVDRVGQRLDGRDHDGVAGMDAQRIDVLHGADRDAGVVRVAHDLVLDLLPADQAALDHHLADGAQPEAGAAALPIRLLGVHDAAAGATQREGGPDDRGQADDAQGVVDARLAFCVRGPLDDHRRRVRLADAVEQVAEPLPVLGHLDGLDGRAQQSRAEALQQAGMRHLDGQVEGRLAAEAGQDALGPLPFQDALHGCHGQRLEIDARPRRPDRS